MEYFYSDSSDSDSREQKTLDLSNKSLETVDFISELNVINEKGDAKKYEILLLKNNLITIIPESINRFSNLNILNLSNNRLNTLPDLSCCPLRTLIATHNNITNESLPKTLFSSKNRLRELNLSGNELTSFPEQILEITTLVYLYIGSNKIVNIPKDIWKLKNLQLLSLCGNQISEVPESVGRLTSLQGLLLWDNLIEQLPASIANLKQLRTLLLHNNRLRTLPPQITKLECLTELSLRDNPLIVRFVRDLTLQPPSLLELAGRTIRMHNIPVDQGDTRVPVKLMEYLNAAESCVNPRCKGVFFENRVEHVKFVDFCGKYRIPLLQYLCSSKCITGSLDNCEESSTSHPQMMRKVLLG